MRDRGKREVEAYNNGGGEGFGEGFVEFPCKKHPASSSSSSISTGGICAYCLTDRLYQLVCPQCGEQRLSSSCSCACTTSDNLFTSNHRNSTSSADVGSVGRISFLLENDKIAVNNNHHYTEVSTAKPKIMEQRSSSNVDDFATLRRSNSTCVGDVNYTTSSGSGVGRKESKEKFWKFGRLFRKKREKPTNHIHNNNYNNNLINHDQENGNYECNGVSRSRSLCSFRGFYDTEESGNFPVSSSSAARASSVSTGNFYADSAKMSCFSESEARISNFDYFDANGFLPNKNNHNSIFSMKETEFMSCDDPAYIDLKLHDVSDQVPNKVPDLAGLRRSGLGLSTKEFSFRGGGGGAEHHQEMFRNGSCRRSSVTERELRKCRKSYKVWRWFFRHQNTSGGTDHLHQDTHHHHQNHHYDAYNS